MKQEDKDLLLKELCVRLPYGIKFECNKNVYTIKGLDLIVTDEGDWEYAVTTKGISPIEIGFIKPYLFPLSSMTEEQKIECFKGTDIELDEYNEIWSIFPISNSDIVLTNLDNWLKVINWLNKNHFDYRGLIEKGLAIDCTNLSIYT